MHGYIFGSSNFEAINYKYTYDDAQDNYNYDTALGASKCKQKIPSYFEFYHLEQHGRRETNKLPLGCWFLWHVWYIFSSQDVAARRTHGWGTMRKHMPAWSWVTFERTGVWGWTQVTMRAHDRRLSAHGVHRCLCFLWVCWRASSLISLHHDGSLVTVEQCGVCFHTLLAWSKYQRYTHRSVVFLL